MVGGSTVMASGAQQRGIAAEDSAAEQSTVARGQSCWLVLVGSERGSVRASSCMMHECRVWTWRGVGHDVAGAAGVVCGMWRSGHCQPCQHCAGIASQAALAALAATGRLTVRQLPYEARGDQEEHKRLKPVPCGAHAAAAHARQAPGSRHEIGWATGQAMVGMVLAAGGSEEPDRLCIRAQPCKHGCMQG
jgi:hypothetical protein